MMQVRIAQWRPELGGGWLIFVVRLNMVAHRQMMVHELMEKSNEVENGNFGSERKAGSIHIIIDFGIFCLTI